ncbi:MAG: CDP-alcohol phosphatidyltransferase family protein [Candidatus Staskawiczbacteria bacterium]|nr:CDP-alcohol phosphatidyltransferase family protein [Candidatus Staskawiczbacteria bacterium]
MQKQIYWLQSFLEWLDSFRDRFLFLFIKPYWPRIITPNHVTYLRAVIGVSLFVLLFFFDITDRILILSLFFIGVLTDFVDGPVARGTNRVTEFGAMLDSTTDRVLLAPIAVYALFGAHKWLLLILFLFEILNALTSLHYKSKEIYLESNIFGKIKMVLMSVAFIAILFYWPITPPLYLFYMLWLTIPLTILSAVTRIIELKNKNKINVPKFKNF